MSIKFRTFKTAITLEVAILPRSSISCLSLSIPAFSSLDIISWFARCSFKICCSRSRTRSRKGLSPLFPKQAIGPRLRGPKEYTVHVQFQVLTHFKIKRRPDNKKLDAFKKEPATCRKSGKQTRSNRRVSAHKGAKMQAFEWDVDYG